MDKIKSFFGGILAALLAAIYFFAQTEKKAPKDPFAEEQAEIEKELAEPEKEAEELSPEEVEDYWGKE